MIGYEVSVFVFVKRETQTAGYSITGHTSRVILFRTLPLAHILSSAELLYSSVSQPSGRGPVPGPGINYTGPRDFLLQFVILVF